jgi:hypothetical protein
MLSDIYGKAEVRRSCQNMSPSQFLAAARWRLNAETLVLQSVSNGATLEYVELTSTTGSQSRTATSCSHSLAQPEMAIGRRQQIDAFAYRVARLRVGERTYVYANSVTSAAAAPKAETMPRSFLGSAESRNEIIVISGSSRMPGA